MMNTISRLLLIPVLILSIILTSCKTTSKAIQTPITEENTSPSTSDQVYSPWSNSLLWEVKSPEADSFTSYIFGTIHIIDSDKFFYPKGTLDALNECSKIFFEIDLDEMNNAGSQMSMMGKLFMNDGMTLSDLMTKEEYKLVADFFENKGFPMIFASKIKPMFLSSMTEMDLSSIDMFGKGSGESDVKSYELDLNDYANNANIEVSGLETMDFQIELFDAIPYDVQADMLVQAVKDSESDIASKMMDELVEVYLAQNIEGLINTIQEDDTMAEYEQVLLNDRNENWIPIIESNIAAQPTFIAVGAGHLAGPKGVLNLLKQKGYLITPISKSND